MCESGAGVRAYARLRADGWTRRRIDAAVRSGGLTRLRRGVYASRGACDATCAAARHGGALTCDSAARHRGLWVVGEDVDVPHVWLRRDGHAYPHERCRCVTHWEHDPAPDTRGVDGLAARDAFEMPGVPQILQHILHCRGVEAFFVTLESALHQGAIGRNGVAWLRAHTNAAARDAIAFAGRDAESGLESLLRWRLRGRGVPIRSQVTIVSVGRVDFLIGERLIVEVDGRQNHGGDEHRHKDRSRDANAAAWGYITLRFDYAQIVHDSEAVVGAILAQVDLGNHLRRG